MKTQLILFGILLIGLFGCTAPADAPQPETGVGAGAPGPEEQHNDTSTAIDETAGTEPPDELPASANETAQEGPSFEKYENIGISFDYPKDSQIDESLGSYPGYATVVMKDNEAKSWILLGFTNVSPSMAGMLKGTSEEIAEGFIDSQNKQDSMGILHQATSKGSTTTYTSPNGFGMAEMNFSVVVDGQGLKGYAIEVYDVDKRARYSVRIFAGQSGVAKELKERFVSTLKYAE